MKKIYKWLKNKLHSHSYSKPIISRYISFNERDIVYECKCGKRKILRTYMPYEFPFPIQTTYFITNKELESHLLQ